MAGHSHWAGIKHKKAANDAKRGKVWSKIARIIIMAAKAGGGDPGQNLTLRYAIDKAKAANMPNDNVTRAIKKGTGELEGEIYHETTRAVESIGEELRERLEALRNNQQLV